METRLPVPGPGGGHPDAPPTCEPSLAWADLAVMSGGTTVWELARIGCPALVVENVPAERALAGGLARVGLFERLGPAAAVSNAGSRPPFRAGALDDVGMAQRPWRGSGPQLVDGGERRGSSRPCPRSARVTRGRSMTSFDAERVLVTGGAGVIAREALELLAAGGATRPVGRPAAAGLPGTRGVNHHVADLAEADLGPLIAFGPRRVLHLAATFERSAESAGFWAQNWSDNVVVTHRLARSAAPGTVEAVVFASSYLVYRTGASTSRRRPPIEPWPRGDRADLARNLCGAAKLYGEAELAFARGDSGRVPDGDRADLPRVRSRLTGMSCPAGFVPPCATSRSRSTTPRTASTMSTAGDVAEGLLRHGNRPRRARASINLGTGVARRVSEVLASDREPRPAARFAPRLRRDEPYEASRADVGRLRRCLGWSPPTSLEEGVARLVAHEEDVMTDESRVHGDRRPRARLSPPRPVARRYGTRSVLPERVSRHDPSRQAIPRVSRLLAGGDEADRRAGLASRDAPRGHARMPDLEVGRPGIAALVDVGAGIGEFVASAAAAGWAAVGLEPSREAVDIAEAKGRNVVCATLEEYLAAGARRRHRGP